MTPRRAIHARPHLRSARLTGWAGVALAATLAAGCGGDGGGTDSSAPTAVAQPTALQWTYPAYSAPNDWAWALPAYLPPPRVPADNPMNAAKVELGRYLFYDTRLSGPGTQSCASCHLQALAFSDGRARPSGVTGALHPRNAMALVNIAYNATQTWANPALLTLEQQITNPVFGTTPVEMGVNEGNVNAVLARLKSATDVDYLARFAAAFPEASGERLDWEHVLKAISAFERTLISANSRYDRWLQGRATLTPQESNGLTLFQTKAQCIQCHAPPHFGDQFVNAATTTLTVRYHNVGLYNIGGTGAYPKDNLGALDLTGNLADMGAFRAPTLRNIAVSAPYMHDGSVATLEEVVAIMAGGGRNVASGPYAGDGRASPYKSTLIQDRGLSAAEQADLVAFLKTLTDEDFLSNPALADPFSAP